MSNPFKKITKNSVASRNAINEKGQVKTTKVASVCCETCGAPRPKDTNLVVCDYCRQPFMAAVKNFKADS